MTDKYDFIVVGAGAAGAILAWRLAYSKQRPSVLLVEAGGKNDSKEVRADAERWLHRMNPVQNWSYKTVPTKGFDGSIIDYDRGKGLGGSTSINFSCWTMGPSEDYDEIARIVGDDEWKWTNAQKRYKRIETFHSAPPEVPDDVQKYLNPRAEDHGHNGPIHTGFPRIWEPSVKELIDIWVENGAKLNPDHNDGDPTGLAMCASTAYNGVRSTSADALVGAPNNLQVLTDTEVSRVVFDGTKATGIETFSGRTIRADKEIILSCGSLDTPRILMYSGIGPEDQLIRYNIPIVKANSNVGQHLKDHHHTVLSFDRADHTSQRHRFYRNKELQEAARAQWQKDGTGPLAEFACSMAIAYEKLDSLYDSPEFQQLPQIQQEHLKKPTVPHYEYLLNAAYLPHFLDPANAAAGTSIFVFVLNMQSSGSAVLQASDPRTPLLFDCNFFAHPSDKRVAIEATREVLKVVKSQQFSKDTIAMTNAPKSDSDEDIVDYWKKTSMSTWHMMGTCRMGEEESQAVVDKDFKVFGVQQLRLADLSVIPVTVNCHTQTTAYLAGLTAGDKIVAEYGLDD
ncbi:hypothetical protein LTR96_006105 [Exophiala xenobiotica]|nr:hypothetical protein LTR96_006105 [Exophiala xenobiotica]KAK5336591.1 hypothetical protein LTR98_006897 [Exophiala xenobiotica]